MILRITTFDGRLLQFHADGAPGLLPQHPRINALRDVSPVSQSLAGSADYAPPEVTCTLGRAAAARYFVPDPLLGAEAVVLDRALREFARGRVDRVAIGEDAMTVQVVA